MSNFSVQLLHPWLSSSQVHCSQTMGAEPRHDKTNNMSVRPAKTQVSLEVHPGWSESSLCAQWVAKDPSFLHADSEDSDQTGRIPSLIWVFAGSTLILLVLSCRGTHVHVWYTDTLDPDATEGILMTLTFVKPDMSLSSTEQFYIWQLWRQFFLLYFWQVVLCRVRHVNHLIITFM